MQTDNDYEDFCFNVPFQRDEGPGYVSIHAEMVPEVQGFSPTGRYFVYCLHPVGGTCHFIVEQDVQGNWMSESLPPFIDDKFIDFIADRAPDDPAFRMGPGTL
ncbi:MAG: hypothetical protein WKF97_08305 [Chitinophagaceae bacterium]